MLFSIAKIISLGLFSSMVEPDFPEPLCEASMMISSPFNKIALNTHDLISIIDDASSVAKRGCGANCDNVIRLFNATDFAARDAGLALSSYTGKLSSSLDMYVTIPHFHERYKS